MSAPEPPDLARLRAAFASLADRPDRAGWPPADAERLFTALHGDMSAEERRAVIEELVRYPDAAAVWRLARELTPGQPMAKMNATAAAAGDELALAAGASARASAGASDAQSAAVSAQATSEGGWTRTRTWLSVAAAALIAVTGGALWQLQSTRSTQAPAYRSATATIASRLPPDAPLPRANPVLRWTAIDDARYHVRVLTPSLDLLDEADEIRVPEYRLGADVLKRIPAGGEILWQVEAIVPGRASAVSPTFSTRVE
jgi:hypothetical protein